MTPFQARKRIMDWSKNVKRKANQVRLYRQRGQSNQSAKSTKKIPKSKHQITNKSQIPKSNDQNRFGISNFGHCDLEFRYFCTPVLRDRSSSSFVRLMNHPWNQAAAIARKRRTLSSTGGWVLNHLVKPPPLSGLTMNM